VLTGPRLNGLPGRIGILWRVVRALLGKRHVYGNITIYGNEDFINLTIKALELLREIIPDTYQLVGKHIGDIVSGTPSGVFTSMRWLGPTFVTISPSCSNGSTREYAGVLAHEAYHCELYSNAERGGLGSHVERSVYSGENAERLCLQYQCDVLRKLGMSEVEVQAYQGLIRTKWWEVPYEKRDW
jgi:hypothetical protein